MAEVVPFRSKAAIAPVQIFKCAACGSTNFTLVKGGAIECSECDALIYDLRHFCVTDSPETA